ncbi:MAG: guanylate kinase [Deltaproteobacteria bacterium]|nr:guanylate kinase [Deltaproteobacteria bacterium]
MTGQIYVISGPSGAGKSTIIRSLRDKTSDLVYSISHTSRGPRGKEEAGVHYHFVDRTTFRAMIEDGAFLEWARVYDDYYGTAYSSIEDQLDSGNDVIMDLDPQGAKNIKKAHPASILIFILPPSYEALEKRLRERATEEERAIQSRLRKAHRQLMECVHYDYLIVNDILDKASSEAAAVITANRCAKARRLSEIEKIFKLQ